MYGREKIYSGKGICGVELYPVYKRVEERFRGEQKRKAIYKRAKESQMTKCTKKLTRLINANFGEGRYCDTSHV